MVVYLPSTEDNQVQSLALVPVLGTHTTLHGVMVAHWSVVPIVVVQFDL